MKNNITSLSQELELDPTKEQVIAFSKACGVYRFTYNWALGRYNELYENYKKDKINNPKPNLGDIEKEFNRIKGELFPWIYDSPKAANQRAFTNLKTAFNRFFKGISKYPKFKNKSKCKDSFYNGNDRTKITDNYIQLSVIGKVKLKNSLRFDNIKIMSCTIKRDGIKWLACINFELINYSRDSEKVQFPNEMIGIDLGLNTYVVTSNGVKIHQNKPYRSNEKKLKLLNRRLSRKQKDSNNRHKAKQKLRKKHYRVKRQRLDFIHKLTTKLCRENQSIVVENLNIKGLMKNHKVAKSFQDAAFGMFKSILTYKAKLFKVNLIEADQFFASSKICSHCGNKKTDLKLSDRTYHCDNCGIEIDRDENAAKNLYMLGYSKINAYGYWTSVVGAGASIVSPVDEVRNTSL